MIEIYEQYYHNQLSEIDKQKFETQLKEDQAIADDYNAYKMIKGHIKSKPQIDTALASLDTINNNIEPSAKVTSLLSQKFTIAATLILVAAALFLLKPPSSPSTQQLFAKHYEPTPVSLVKKSDTEQRTSAKLSELYNTKNYSQALAFYFDIKQSLPEDPKINLLVSNLYMKNNYYEEALVSLELLATNPNFKTTYHWHKGLCYLAMEDSSKAKLAFLEIPPSSNYYKKAKLILDQLNKK